MGATVVKGEFIRSVPINRKNFARYLTAEMRLQSLTAQMLANKSGVAEPTIKQMCAGYEIKNSPNVALYTLVGLADALGLQHGVVVGWACDCIVARKHLCEAQRKSNERIARRKSPNTTLVDVTPAKNFVPPAPPAPVIANVASVMVKVRNLNTADLELISSLIDELT